jgi:uncharacterized protein (TIGR02145 family)/prepilin-type N-terminal cleavage/methylation domain-containing protein
LTNYEIDVIVSSIVMIKISMNKTNKKAFTLIELLVAIAIIGILATIAVVALQQARQSARDSKRIADVKQIQTALELYYNYNSEYPAEITNNQIADGTTVYMEIVPTAPTPADGDCDTSSNQYTYIVGEDNATYTLSFCLGSQVGGLSYGDKCAIPGGLLDSACPCASISLISCGNSCEYQGHVYGTVAIGDQCWFAENLRYDNGCGEVTWLNESDEGWCGYYNNNSNNEEYGLLYQWSAIMNGSEEEGAQGICPDGWRIPGDTSSSSGDWHDLISFIGSNPGTKLKAAAPAWNGGDDFGFTALAGGGRESDGSFVHIGSLAHFWSSSSDGTNALRRGLHLHITGVYRNNLIRSRAFSVRCLRTD